MSFFRRWKNMQIKGLIQYISLTDLWKRRKLFMDMKRES